MRHTWKFLTVAVRLFAIAIGADAGSPMGNVGKFVKWDRVEIALEGPEANGESGDPNPFLIDVWVNLEGPRGKTCKVPAYFDGDGRGGAKGSVWQVRFSADEIGRWRFAVESEDAKLNGCSGTFDVVAPPSDSPLPYRRGRLQFVREPYLKFAEGPYWLKGGTDSPENFLGLAMGDWDRKKRQVDYLVEQGVNCVYIMTHNVRGDGRDVWPWVGPTEREAMRNPRRFDVAKLRRWQDFFEYIQRRGIVIQIVLNDDSAWLGYNHRLYLREMVARLGYLPAIYWNVGEEYREAFRSWEAGLRYAELLAELDPYDHPIAIHNVNEPRDDMIRNPRVNVTSIQTKEQPPEGINALAVRWRRRADELGSPIVVSFDEGRPPLDRRSVWAAYMGGAMWEAIDNTLEKSAESTFAKNALFWREMLIAREFVETLPFQEMKPDNELVEGGFCLAKRGEVYAVYAPEGGEIGLDLSATEGAFGVRWLNPKTGRLVAGSKETVKGGAVVSLGLPPFDGDAAVTVRKK